MKVFPQGESLEVILHSNQSVVEQAREALKTNQIERGVCDFSILNTLPRFDIVWNVPYDSMHGTYQGVIMQSESIANAAGERWYCR